MSTKLPQIQPTSSKVIVGNDKKAPIKLFKKRSVSEVEDPISQLQKNLFTKLEKYDKDENENLNKSFGVLENSQSSFRKITEKKNLNNSFNVEVNKNGSKRGSINLQNSNNLLEDDDMTDEQFFQDLCGDSININKGKPDKIVLGSTLSFQTKGVSPQVKIRNQHNVSFSGNSNCDKLNRSRHDLNSSFSSSQQENINKEKVKQSNQAPFLTNILDQIDQNSNVIRSKNNFTKLSMNQNTITPKKIISDSKTLNVNYQINSNITNMQVFNSLSDKKDNQKISISKLNNQTQSVIPKNVSIDTQQQNKLKDKKVIFYTPFQNEIMKKEKERQEQKTSEFKVINAANSNMLKPQKQDRQQNKRKEKVVKELQEYNENYTGLESFDESDNSQDYDDNDDIKMLQEYDEYYEQNYIEEEGQQLSNQIVNIKKECQDLDNDLFDLKDLLSGMRGDWKEYEELGADFGDIDQFIKEVDIFQKEKDLQKQNSVKLL